MQQIGASQGQGFGFITCGSEEYFFHASNLLNCGIDDLSPGDEVELGKRRGRERSPSERCSMRCPRQHHHTRTAECLMAAAMAIVTSARVARECCTKRSRALGAGIANY